jgi:hypothetical protein
MQGNIALQKRLRLLFSKINIYERQCIKEATLMKRKIFSSTLKNSTHIENIDELLVTFKDCCKKEREIINSLLNIPLDKLIENGSKYYGNKTKRESDSTE